MKVKHLIEQQLKHGRGILTESCEGLTDQQRLIVEGIYNDLEILVEASLTPDQIQGVFGAVEKEVTAGGDNRTLAGLGVDAAKQVDQTIDNIGKWLQDTKPVQAFDQKFEDLKTKIAQKFPKVAAQAAKLGDWAKENPGKTAAIIGVLTTIAALGTGPVGGAIAGQILRGSAELLKGEKLSTAVGKGIKTAAYGAVAGWLLDGLGDWLEGLRAKVVPYDKVPGLVKIEVGMTKTLTAPGMRYEQSIHNIFVPADAAEGFQTIVDLARDGDVNAFNDISSYVDRFSIKEYLKDKAIQDAAAQALAQQNDAFLQSMKAANEVIRAAAQGAIAGKLDASQVKVDGQPMNAGQGQKENVYRQQRPLSEGQVYMLFARVLNEGPLDWLKKKAHNITTKLTADKLNSAWQKAGSPTDSEELRQFLTSQNISDDIINKVYDEMKIGAEPPGGDQEPPAGSAAMSYKEIKDLVPKLQKKEKQRLIAYLQKQLGTA